MTVSARGLSPIDSTSRRAFRRRARRLGVGLFFTSVAVNAALGISAVLSPDFGETQAKVLGTSLCVTGAALVALACEPAWERSALGLVPVASAALAGAGFALVIAVVWIAPASESWQKLATTILTIAVAGAIASLLALARLRAAHRWIRAVTFSLLAIATAFYAALPWFPDPPEWVVRGFGVVAIGLAAFVVTVPVVHWLDRASTSARSALAGHVRFCPFCAGSISGSPDEPLRCTRCGREFRVAVPRNTTSNLT